MLKDMRPSSQKLKKNAYLKILSIEKLLVRFSAGQNKYEINSGVLIIV